MNDKVESPLALASEIARAAKLKSLVISRGEFGYSSPGKDWKFSFQVDQRHVVDGSALLSIQTITLNAPLSEEPDGALGRRVRIQAAFEIAYDISGVDSPAPASIEAFSRINSLYNAWPYWREFVQSCVQRMGLPMLTLPLLTASRAVELSGLGPTARKKQPAETKAPKAAKKKVRKNQSTNARQ